MKRYRFLSFLMIFSLLFVFNTESFAQLSKVGESLKTAAAISETEKVESSWGTRDASFDKVDDALGTARGEISTHKKLDGMDAYSGLRYTRTAKTAGKNKKTKIQDTSTFGVWSEGTFGALAFEKGAILDVKSNDNSIGSGLKHTRLEQYESEHILSATKADGVVGAEARAEGNYYVGKNGIELGGSAAAKVGAWVESDSGITFKAGNNRNVASVVSGVSVGASLGAGAEGNVSLRNDRVGLEVGVDVGFVKLKLGGYVNPIGIFEAVKDKTGGWFSSSKDDKKSSGGAEGASGKGSTNNGSGGSGGSSGRITN